MFMRSASKLTRNFSHVPARMHRALMFLAVILAMILMADVASTRAQDTGTTQPPRLETNEEFIRSLGATGLDIDDPRGVFQFVLDGLPARVMVYPTENYYYFRFIHEGVGYSGNIRLDPDGRELARVNFGYYKDTNEWLELEDEGQFTILGAEDGVSVERLAPLTYKISSRGTSVIFELNDLSDVRPPRAAMADGDRFIGPVFDESGIRFFLLFNDRFNRFSFILDETSGRSEELVPLSSAPRVLVGRRTGFAYYSDAPGRLILMAVYAPNVQVNNYYDGPFDQLPDNFIKGDELREAILKVDPSYEGSIDRFGNLEGTAVRYLISPYRGYLYTEELVELGACADTAQDLDAMLACFDEPDHGESEPDAALQTDPASSSER